MLHDCIGYNMAVYDDGELIKFERYDILYNKVLGGAALIRYIQRNKSSLFWFTGSKAQEIQKIENDKLLQKVKTDTWEIILEKSERGRKTQKFFESLFNCVDISEDYQAGDKLPRFPREDKYVKTGISYGFFDHKKELSEKGADILSHYIGLSQTYSRNRVFKILDREGVETFVRHATRLSNPALYEYLRDCLKDASFTSEKDYILKDYPHRSLLIKFDIELDDPEEKASQMKKYLQSKGFHVSYKRDDRFTNGRNPRVLSVRESSFNGQISSERF